MITNIYIIYNSYIIYNNDYDYLFIYNKKYFTKCFN